jgi:uncharacterized membrane protein
MMQNFIGLLAETVKPIKPSDIGIPKVTAEELLPGILNTVYWIAGVAAVIVIVVAGIFYAISQGEAAKIKRAKDAILYSVIGLVVIMFAFVITNFVIGRFN